MTPDAERLFESFQSVRDEISDVEKLGERSQESAEPEPSSNVLNSGESSMSNIDEDTSEYGIHRLGSAGAKYEERIFRNGENQKLDVVSTQEKETSMIVDMTQAVDSSPHCVINQQSPCSPW